MVIHVSEELEALIHDRTTKGQYKSTDEFLRQIIAEADDHVSLRVAIAAGTKQLEHGETISGEEAFKRIRERSRQRRAGA